MESKPRIGAVLQMGVTEVGIGVLVRVEVGLGTDVDTELWVGVDVGVSVWVGVGVGTDAGVKLPTCVGVGETGAGVDGTSFERAMRILVTTPVNDNSIKVTTMTETTIARTSLISPGGSLDGAILFVIVCPYPFYRRTNVNRIASAKMTWCLRPHCEADSSVQARNSMYVPATK